MTALYNIGAYMEFKSPIANVVSTDVVLVNMPFGGAFNPALGLSILSQQLKIREIKHQTMYYSLSLANIIGARRYQLISEFYPDSSMLLGEWIFSQSLFGPSEPPSIFHAPKFEMARNYVNYPDISPASLIQDAVKIGQTADDFIKKCAADILLRRPKIVALASMFQQNVASISLAKQLKSLAPEIRVVMGGANCEGIMGAGLCELFPYLDYVVSGAGEVSFVTLCEAILEKRSTIGIPGVRSAASKYIPFVDAQELPLNAMADPGFDDFFEQLAHFPELRAAVKAPTVLLETSRGCWWGQKHHCTFCGLNGSTMDFRYKSAEVAFDEIKNLERKYPGCKIATVDNIIPMQYFTSLLPKLKASPVKSPIFYETKANLRRSQLLQLAQAGILETQPGIESFSNRVLEIMNKGTTWPVNIQYLKWAKQVGITPRWNILYGFPGETSVDYDFTLTIIPLLMHLEPPAGVARIRLDRFSPNYERAQEMGFENVRPIEAYSYVYRGVDDKKLANIAYFFASDYAVPMEFASYETKLQSRCNSWRENAEKSVLAFIKQTNGGVLIDTRGPKDVCYHLSEYEATILRELDEVTTLKNISAKHGNEAERIVERFVSLGISLSDGTKLLGLSNFFFEDGLVPSPHLLSRVSNEGLTVTPLFGEIYA